ncbi:hypothetical protein GOODEAATRI_013941 [Goodea atripinnis]|uniref:Uncharacterized protein n=1 Tax=Goodea atripinnis TaxID=208336 RepID=A0ABV0NLP3_9TELE
MNVKQVRTRDLCVAGDLSPLKQTAEFKQHDFATPWSFSSSQPGQLTPTHHSISLFPTSTKPTLRRHHKTGHLTEGSVCADHKDHLFSSKARFLSDRDPNSDADQRGQGSFHGAVPGNDTSAGA